MTAKHILVPVDFSKGSDRAVAQAESLASALGADLELFHAYQLPVLALPDSSVTVSPTYVADLTERAQRELDRHRIDAREPRRVSHAKLLEGNPADTIVERAEALRRTDDRAGHPRPQRLSPLLAGQHRRARRAHRHRAGADRSPSPKTEPALPEGSTCLASPRGP